VINSSSQPSCSNALTGKKKKGRKKGKCTCALERRREEDLEKKARFASGRAPEKK